MAEKRKVKGRKTPPKRMNEGLAKRKGTADTPPRVRALVRGSFIVVVALALVVVGLLLFVYPTTQGATRGDTAVEFVVVADDESSLAARLEREGLVENHRFFSFYLRARGGTSSLAKGPHYLPLDLTPQELLARLQRRGAAHVKVVIPEGWNRYDIAKRLDALRVCTLRGFVVATDTPALLGELHVEGPSAEGYLFPATYDLELDSEPADVVRRMVREFDKRWNALDEKHADGLLDLGSSLHWGRREVVVLASMVEKEAAVDDERAIIASVFLNRLRDATFEPKLLQCDPTAGYGCLVGASPGCVGFAGKITHDVVADAENPYNTYKHVGLPPGPIGNPGARSLEAVLAPAMTHYFYFVAKGAGRHTFSETYAAHAAAVHHEDAGAASPVVP